MIQSSTSPWWTTMLGACRVRIERRGRLAVDGDDRNRLALFGIVRIVRASRRNTACARAPARRCRARAARRRQRRRVERASAALRLGRVGRGDDARRARGWDRSRRPARYRPSGHEQAPALPAGGPSTMNSTRAARRQADVIDPCDWRRRAAVELQRYAVDGDDAELLRCVAEQHGEIQIGDGRGIQHAPQLPLAGLHRDRRRRIVRVGHGHVVDRQVLGRLAEAGAVVGRVAVAIDQHLRHDRLGF